MNIPLMLTYYFKPILFIAIFILIIITFFIIAKILKNTKVNFILGICIIILFLLIGISWLITKSSIL